MYDHQEAPGMIRLSRGSSYVWLNFCNHLHRRQSEIEEKIGVRRFVEGKLTNSAVLDVALDIAMTALDPGHAERNPVPPGPPPHLELTEATNDELLRELLDVETRLQRLRAALAERLQERPQTQGC